MLNNFTFTANAVMWTFGGKSISLALEKVFIASVDKINQTVIVQIGDNFSCEAGYIYDYFGNPLLCYDLESGKIQWDYQKEQQELVIENLRDVGFFYRKGLLLLQYFSAEKTNAIVAFNLQGDYLYEIQPPQDFSFEYFQETAADILIVCEGSKSKTDQFGRSRFNFKLNELNGTLTKGSLAY